MFRDSTSASAADVILDVRPGGAVEFMSRPSNGAATTFIAGGTQTLPAWLKLVRSGSTFTGYVSPDGSTWTKIGSTSATISSAATVGLAVTSHTTSVLGTSTFDNVNASAATSGGGGGTAASNVVIYATDITTVKGNWSKVSDPKAAAGIKLVTPANGATQPNNPLASPANFVEATFNAVAGTPYTLWLRLQALNNSKNDDSLWVQFSDAQIGGTAAYPIGTTKGLAVNLAADSTGASVKGWGWVDGAYWLTQGATVTFASTGSHTLRIQMREDGVEFDQIVLSPTTYFNASASCPTICSGAPGPISNDNTIVPKP